LSLRMLVFGQVFIIVWASVAIILSSIVISTFILVEEWRNDLKRVKRLLFIMSFCVLIEGGAAMDVGQQKSIQSCKIQAVLIEVGKYFLCPLLRIFVISHCLFSCQSVCAGSLCSLGLSLCCYTKQYWRSKWL
jgi:O-antigen/teichoic acid export membrane protein